MVAEKTTVQPVTFRLAINLRSSERTWERICAGGIERLAYLEALTRSFVLFLKSCPTMYSIAPRRASSLMAFSSIGCCPFRPGQEMNKRQSAPRACAR